MSKSDKLFAVELFAEIVKEADAPIKMKVGDSEIDVRDGSVTITKPCAEEKFEFTDKNFITKAVEFIKSKIEFYNVCVEGQYCQSIRADKFAEIMKSNKTDKQKHKALREAADFYQTFNVMTQGDFDLSSSFNQIEWADVVEFWGECDEFE